MYAGAGLRRLCHWSPRRAVAWKGCGRAGLPDPADAPATIEAIGTAVELVAAGRASAVVTNPIAKSVLYRAGFGHPGHTEYLGELAAQFFGQAARPVMMLWSRELAVIPATIHVPLARVAALLGRTDLIEIGEIVAEAFRRDFGLAAPRLAFAGLNPHAGENGAIGSEEIDIIAPAVAALRRRDITATGRFPPTRCSMPRRGQPTMSPSACITTRR